MVIATVYVALLALLLMALSVRVMMVRTSAKVGIGDGGNHALLRAIRAHGNAAENIPIGALLLVAMAAMGFTALWLHVAGATLLVARLLHAWGLSQSSSVSFGRGAGVALTLAAICGMAIALLVKAAMA